MIRSDLLTPAQPQPRRLRFSVEDYYKMIELGMIKDYERAEIIDGEMVPKMTIGDRHAFAVDLLNRLFARSLPDEIMVRIQNPLRQAILTNQNPTSFLLISPNTMERVARVPKRSFWSSRSQMHR